MKRAPKVRVTIDPATGERVFHAESRESCPGAEWPVTAKVERNRFDASCPCPSKLRFCAHVEAVAEILVTDGLVEPLPGGGFAPPLPSEDGDEAAVAALLGQRASMSAVVR